MTAQVATVRHKMSVPANFQMANNAESTATRMQPLVVQKEMLLTISGFRKPRFFRRGCEFSKSTPVLNLFSELPGFMALRFRTGNIISQQFLRS